jgi:hypothetical protein
LSLRTVLDSQIESYADKLERLERRKKSRNPDDNRLIRSTRSRLNNGQDCRILVTGESGIGKSAFALRIGEILNPEIYVNDIQKAVYLAVSFKALDFLNSTELPNGSLLDFDEPGQGWFHRNFMSEASKMLAQTFIGMRFQQHISVLTIPNVSLLDIDAVRLLTYHVHVEAHGRATVYRMMDQRFGGDPWRKTEIDRMTYGMPDIKLWHLYEKRKFEFQRALYEKFRKDLQAGEAPSYSNMEIADLIAFNPEPYMKDGQIHHSLIQNAFGIGINRAYSVKAGAAQLMQKKAKESATPPP